MRGKYLTAWAGPDGEARRKSTFEILQNNRGSPTTGRIEQNGQVAISRTLIEYNAPMHTEAETAERKCAVRYGTFEKPTSL